MKSGNGILIYEEGGLRYGQWNDDLFEGKGIEISADGGIFYGEYF
jgi:hypothetical protein